jgi:hypothetical protein
MTDSLPAIREILRDFKERGWSSQLSERILAIVIPSPNAAADLLRLALNEEIPKGQNFFFWSHQLRARTRIPRYSRRGA